MSAPRSYLGLAIPLAVAVFALVGFLQYLSYSNRAAVLEVAARNQQDVNRTVYDTVWKTIQGQAGVGAEYERSFQRIYVDLMDARYQSGGELMKFIQEANPDFDSSLFHRIMSTIQEQRAVFQQAQQKLISIREEHQRLKAVFPGSIYLASRPDIQITLVTSAKTEADFQSGQDNDDPDPFAKYRDAGTNRDPVPRERSLP